WGTGRAQADYASTPTGDDTTLTLDQTWTMPAGTRFSTSAYASRITGAITGSAEQDSTVLGLSAYGGGQLTSRLGVEGNVRWATAVQGQAAPGVYSNVAVTYQLSQNWKVLLSYYDTEISAWTPLTVVSPLTPPVATPIPSMQEKGIFL